MTTDQTGTKVTAGALLDRAQAAAESNNEALAAKILERLVMTYPDSPEAAVAQKSLGKTSGREVQAVRVIDVDIKFATMVMLMIKFVIASIPAAIILAFLAAVVIGALGGLGGL